MKVAQLAAQQESLQAFEFLRALAPKMTVAEFGAHLASAFFLWPKELLEAELNRNALASTFNTTSLRTTPTAGGRMSLICKRR